jgi:very-short-patch-repair endonuclease
VWASPASATQLSGDSSREECMRRRLRVAERILHKPGADRGKLAFARAMRAEPTAAEAALWVALRGRRLGGWKFRRQHVVAGYIVDFYCAQLWLAIEVDGGVHRGRGAEDVERAENLASLGVRIVRLRNADVLERINAVVDELASRCGPIAMQLGIPSPAPAGEG